MDSTVLPELFTDDPTWNSWSKTALGGVRTAGLAKINPLIYSETSFAFNSAPDLDRELDSLLLACMQLPFEAVFSTGQALLKYRRAGGARSSPMPGPYVGAHAGREKLTLLTRDAQRYRAYFPSVKLISPPARPSTPTLMRDADTPRRSMARQSTRAIIEVPCSPVLSCHCTDHHPSSRCASQFPCSAARSNH